jgi:hypothetical protein
MEMENGEWRETAAGRNHRSCTGKEGKTDWSLNYVLGKARPAKQLHVNDQARLQIQTNHTSRKKQI